MGKNFSANNVTGKRKKSDFYETPYSLTRQFIEKAIDERIFNTQQQVLEPAAGNGAIVNVLKDYWESSLIHAYDKVVDGKDFRDEHVSYPYIITNPPFSRALQFINKAKEVVGQTFAYLLPLSYLHGKARYDALTYRDEVFPLSRVWVYTRYPMLGDPLRKDGKYRTGMMVYAWYIWDRDHSGQPEIDWIDNQEYVLTKKEAE